jgi:hypothetical protein
MFTGSPSASIMPPPRWITYVDAGLKAAAGMKVRAVVSADQDQLPSTAGPEMAPSCTLAYCDMAGFMAWLKVIVTVVSTLTPVLPPAGATSRRSVEAAGAVTPAPEQAPTMTDDTTASVSRPSPLRPIMALVPVAWVMVPPRCGAVGRRRGLGPDPKARRAGERAQSQDGPAGT